MSVNGAGRNSSMTPENKSRLTQLTLQGFIILQARGCFGEYTSGAWVLHPNVSWSKRWIDGRTEDECMDRVVEYCDRLQGYVLDAPGCHVR